MLKQRHVNKPKDDISSVLRQNVSTKMRVHKIRLRTADSHLEGKKGKFLLLLPSNDCIIKKIVTYDQTDLSHSERTSMETSR